MLVGRVVDFNKVIAKLEKFERETSGPQQVEHVRRKSYICGGSRSGGLISGPMSSLAHSIFILGPEVI